MAEPKKSVTFDEERLERLIGALAFASTGDFEEAIAQIHVVEPDQFGVLEKTLRRFVTELADTTQQSRQALAALAASKQEIEDKLLTIERQQLAISELQVPIIDVWQGILTLPLVGLFDTSRAVDLTEKLLHRVADSDVEWVILDLTGVNVVDTMTAQHIIKLSQAVQLLGARCILTGIGGNVAQALITLGVSLDELNPLRSLREGLKYCIWQQSRKAKENET
jgi:rsbT co-antagonist protein RsbR